MTEGRDGGLTRAVHDVAVDQDDDVHQPDLDGADDAVSLTATKDQTAGH